MKYDSQITELNILESWFSIIIDVFVIISCLFVLDGLERKMTMIIFVFHFLSKAGKLTMCGTYM